MAGPQPYLHFAGSARAALEFYHSVFGGELTVHSHGDFGRDDGPADAVAHGILSGPVELFAADAGPDEETLELRGILFSLLGAADPAELHRWFDALAEGGSVTAPLQRQEWGATDGQVRDRHGITWLIGYEGE